MTKTIINIPTEAGQLAGRKTTFGNNKRYAYAPVHTRFHAVQWFIWDAEAPTEDGAPEVIRQYDSFADVDSFVKAAKEEECRIMDAERM